MTKITFLKKNYFFCFRVKALFSFAKFLAFGKEALPELLICKAFFVFQKNSTYFRNSFACNAFVFALQALKSNLYKNLFTS